MSLFSEFREKLKVKTEDKEIKKYTYGNINIREDKETGNLELYLVDDYSGETEAKGCKTHGFKMRDINIRNSENKIDYTFVVSASGLFYRREYADCKDAERYKKIYSVPSVLQQILGVSREQAYNMQFTMEELIELIEKINKEKENAIYQFVNLVEYSDNYKGEKVLDGLHIARTDSYNLDDRRHFRCIEDENIEIKMNENNTLIIMKDGKKEMISKENFEFILTDILDYRSSRKYASLGGFTLEAARKRVVVHKKEKENGKGEK